MRTARNSNDSHRKDTGAALFRYSSLALRSATAVQIPFSSMTAHIHVLGVKHLLRDFWHSRCTTLQGTARREGRKVRHEEVDPQEGNEVDRTLPQIAIRLSRESDVRRHPADGGRHDMVQDSVDRNRQLQGTKTDVAQRLVSSSMHSSAPNASMMRTGYSPRILETKMRSRTEASQVVAALSSPRRIQQEVNELCILELELRTQAPSRTPVVTRNIASPSSANSKTHPRQRSPPKTLCTARDILEMPSKLKKKILVFR